MAFEMAIYNREQRELCKALWCAGLSFAEIEAKTGIENVTARQWSSREKWNRLREAVKVHSVTSPVDSDKPSIAKSKSIRELAADVIGQDLTVISTKPSKTPNAALKRQADLVPLISNASKVLGWSDAPPSTLVNIAVLNPHTDNTPSAINDAAPVIDCPAIEDTTPTPEGD